MKPIQIAFAVTIFAVVSSVLWLTPSSVEEPSEASDLIPAASAPDRGVRPLTADRLLLNHGTPDSTASQDIQLLAEVISTLGHSYRHVDTIEFSNNAALTELLLGKPHLSHPELSSTHSILGRDEHGHLALTDRWGTAYHLHLVDRSRIELVSAGPDETFGTPDDLAWPPLEPSL